MSFYNNSIDAGSCVYYLSVFAGTICFRKKENTFFRTYLLTFQSVIYLVFFTVCVVLSWNEDLFPFPQISRSKIITFISIVSANAINVATIAEFISSQVHCKVLCDSLEKMEEIDKTIKFFTNDISQMNYFIWKRSVIITILWGVYYLAYTAFSVFFYTYSVPQMITLIMFQLMQISGVMQYWAWTGVLRDRFIILNNFLRKNAQESLQMKYPFDEVAFAENLKNLIMVHRSLTEVARSVNACFFCFLFFYTFFYYVMLASNGYIAVYLFAFSNLNDWYNILTIFNCWQFILYNTIFLYVLLTTVTEMCYQANCAAGVLTEIQINLNKITIRNLVTSKTLSLMNNKLEVSAWKFFKIDMELLHSIIASITIYLVIMLQFDVEASKKLLEKAYNNTTHVANV